MRKIDCAYYEKCLDEAARKDAKKLGCKECEEYKKGEDDGR